MRREWVQQSFKDTLIPFLSLQDRRLNETPSTSSLKQEREHVRGVTSSSQHLQSGFVHLKRTYLCTHKEAYHLRICLKCRLRFSKRWVWDSAGLRSFQVMLLLLAHDNRNQKSRGNSKGQDPPPISTVLFHCCSHENTAAWFHREAGLRLSSFGKNRLAVRPLITLILSRCSWRSKEIVLPAPQNVS